jgi:hypothetical protein
LGFTPFIPFIPNKNLDQKREEWNFRLDCLKKQIDYWIENKTEKMIETIHLFFDNHSD